MLSCINWSRTCGRLDLVTAGPKTVRTKGVTTIERMESFGCLSNRNKCEATRGYYFLSFVCLRATNCGILDFAHCTTNHIIASFVLSNPDLPIDDGILSNLGVI